MVFELQFKDVILVNFIRLTGSIHGITEKREASQGEIILEGLIKVEAKVCENNPEFLPPVGVLEFSKKVAGQLIFQSSLVIHDGHAGGPVPAHVNGRVTPLS